MSSTLDTEPTYRLPSAPPAQGGADIVVIADAEGQGPTFDPETGMTVIEADDGNVEVSVGPPVPEKKDSDFGDNLAELLAETDLSSIAERLLTGIEADDQSRSDWLTNAASSLSLLGLEVKSNTASGAVASTTPAEGTSQVDHPLLLEAVLRFQANARGELLPTDGPVKVRNDGEGTAANEALAKALEKDLNHYLTKTAKEYYPDTDRMLLLLGFCGISFKKGFHDPIKRRPVIASIDAKDLIVSNTSTDLDGAGRVTHRMMMRPSVLKRMQMVGAYRDIDLPVAPTLALKNAVDQKIDEIQGVQTIGIAAEVLDQDRELYECYCEIDIPGFEHRDEDDATTGLPLPYKVVIDKDARKILEIRRNWDEDDDVLCMPINRIIAYVFIPGIGFYGIGLLNVLGNAAKAITAAWRLMLDAGMFSNFPGFLYLKQFGKQLTNQFRVPPGGGLPIDAAGLNDIRAAIMPLPYKDPSAVFIQLIDNIANMARQVGGTAEAMIGEGKQDAPVGTTLALIEQATKIMSAVHKRLHQAQGQEFVMLKELLMEDPEALWRHNKKSKVLDLLKQQHGLAPLQGKEDAETERHKQMILAALADMELIPMADPNTSSQTERYLKVTALRQMAMTNPSMDLNAVDQRALRTMGVDDADSLFRQADPNAQPGQDPTLIMALASQMMGYARMLDAQTKAKDAATKAASAAQDSINKDKELASKEHIARLNVARELVIHGSDQETAQRELAMTQSDKAQDRAHQTHLAALGHVADMHNAGQDRAHEVGLQNVVHQHQAFRDALKDARQSALKAPQGVAPATQ